MSELSFDNQPMRLQVILALLIWMETAGANPIIRDRAFLVSERLVVALSSKTAPLVGHFRFQRTRRDIARTEWWVPVWLPEPGLKKRTDRKEPIRIAEESLSTRRSRRVEREAAIRGAAGGVELRPQAVLLFDEVSRLGSESARAGYRVALFKYVVDGNQLDAPEPVTINYRQSLLRVRPHRLFYDVPLLWHRPEDRLPDDPNAYEIVLQADDACRLTVTQGEETLFVEPGERVTLTPQDGRAIEALVIELSNSQSRQTPTRSSVEQDRKVDIVHPVEAPFPVGGASLRSAE